jgi:hypothetical protein
MRMDATALEAEQGRSARQHVTLNEHVCFQPDMAANLAQNLIRYMSVAVVQSGTMLPQQLLNGAAAVCNASADQAAWQLATGYFFCICSSSSSYVPVITADDTTNAISRAAATFMAAHTYSAACAAGTCKYGDIGIQARRTNKANLKYSLLVYTSCCMAASMRLSRPGRQQHTWSQGKSLCKSKDIAWLLQVIITYRGCYLCVCPVVYTQEG